MPNFFKDFYHFRFDVQPTVKNHPKPAEPVIDYSEYVDDDTKEKLTPKTQIDSSDSFEKEDIYHIRNEVGNVKKRFFSVTLEPTSDIKALVWLARTRSRNEHCHGLIFL